MKNGIIFIGCLLAHLFAWSQTDFQTKWDLSNSTVLELEFKLASSGPVNYTWEDDQANTGNGVISAGTTTASITVPGTGIYTLSLSPTNLDRFYTVSTTATGNIVELVQWGSTDWTSTAHMFDGCYLMEVTATDAPDLSNVTDMQYMFSTCAAITTIPSIDQWNVSTVAIMTGMFNNADNFTGTNQNGGISNWNTGSTTHMDRMFRLAQSFNADISSWNTANVTNMEAMFSGATSFNQDIGSWDTGALQNTSFMFYIASSFNQNINAWDMSNVLVANNMFQSATSFNQPLDQWDVSGCYNMTEMFKDATSFNQDLTNWNTPLVQVMTYMFENTPIDYNFGGWNFSGLMNADGMFKNSNMSCANYSATLIGWRNLPNIPFTMSMIDQAGMSYGTNAVAARDYLTNTLDWTIAGDVASGSDCTLELSEEIDFPSVELYPNPAIDRIQLIGLLSFPTEVHIADAHGRTISVTPDAGGSISIADLAPGVYMLFINANQEVIRFVKQ